MKIVGVLVFALAAVGAGVVVYLHQAPESWEPRVVTIDSQESLGSLMPSWIAWMSDAEPGASQALLLRDRDIIFGGRDLPFEYLASDGAAVKLTFTEWSARVGGTTVTIAIGPEDGRAWVDKATASDLAAIRTVVVPEELDEPTSAALKRLAAACPNASITVESETSLREALAVFKPHAVFMSDAPAAGSRLLSDQRQIDTLFLKADQPGSLDVLSSLPNVRRLIISNWDVGLAGGLPDGLSSLRSLLVADSEGITDLAPLRLPAGLQELSLLDLKNLTDLSPLQRLTGLRVLHLSSNKELADLSSLSTLSGLRWIGVPAKTTQTQFASFAAAHSDLTILDLIGNKEIHDLAPVADLRHLEGVVLDGTYDNLEVLQNVHTLRFVGLSQEILEGAPAKVAAIRKALPDAIVVRVRPFCLGSGWVLLLLPLVAAAVLARRPRRRANAAA